MSAKRAKPVSARTWVDRAQPGYRAWQQKVRQRAARRLQHLYPEDWKTLLAEEQAAEPFNSGAVSK